MKTQVWLKKVNVVLFLLVFFQAMTGLGHELLNEEFFETVHPSVGILLILFVILHLKLNWGWVKSVYFKKS